MYIVTVSSLEMMGVNSQDEKFSEGFMVLDDYETMKEKVDLIVRVGCNVDRIRIFETKREIQVCTSIVFSEINQPVAESDETN